MNIFRIGFLVSFILLLFSCEKSKDNHPNPEKESIFHEIKPEGGNTGFYSSLK